MRIHTFEELQDVDFSVTRLRAAHSEMMARRFFRCGEDARRYDRFFYVQEGEYSITQDGYPPLVLHKGDLLYLPNNCLYTSQWTGKRIEYCSIEFVLRDSEPFSLSDRIQPILCDQGGMVLNLIRQMVTVLAHGKSGYRLKAKSLFFELLYLVIRERTQENYQRHYKDIHAALFYLENNYYKKNDPASLARMCNMSKSSFRSYFLKATGVPPIRYQNMLRIKKAKELLANEDNTVTEVAEIVGFSDVAYFNRVFRSFIRENPSEYRARQKSVGAGEREKTEEKR